MNYKNGKEHGYHRKNYADSKIYEMNYKEGKEHGFQKTTFNDGRVVELNCKNGKLHGEWKNTDPNEGNEIIYYCEGKLIL